MRTGRRLLGLALSLSLLLGLLPTSVWAANGPYEGESNDGAYAAGHVWLCTTSNLTVQTQLFRAAYTYNGSSYAEVRQTVTGASYDKASNTLTLDGLNGEGKYLVIERMGEDFKIALNGASTIDFILINGYSYGGSVTFTGSGSLTVSGVGQNGYLRYSGIQMSGGGGPAVLTVENTATLTVSAQEGEPAISVINTASNPGLVVSGACNGRAGHPIVRKATVPWKNSDGTQSVYIYHDTNEEKLYQSYEYYGLSGTYQGHDTRVRDNQELDYLSFSLWILESDGSGGYCCVQNYGTIYVWADDPLYVQYQGDLNALTFDKVKPGLVQIDTSSYSDDWAVLDDSDDPLSTVTITPGSAALRTRITTAALPSGEVGASYQATLTAEPATDGATITWSAAGLPAGISLDASTGQISGTPTVGGTFSVTITATETNASPSYNDSVTREYALTVTKPQHSAGWLTTLALGSAVAGQTTAYTVTLQPSGLPDGTNSFTPSSGETLTISGFPSGVLAGASASVTTPESGVSAAISADKTAVTLTFGGTAAVTAESGVVLSVTNAANPAESGSISLLANETTLRTPSAVYRMSAAYLTASIISANGVRVTIDNYDSVKDMDLSLRLTYGSDQQTTQTVYGSTAAFNVDVGSGSYTAQLFAYDALGQGHAYSAAETGTGSGGAGNEITVTPNGSDLTGYTVVKTLNGAPATDDEQNGISTTLRIATQSGTNYLSDYGSWVNSAWVSRYWFADADLFESGTSGATKLSVYTYFDPGVSGLTNYDRETPQITADKASKKITVNYPSLQTNGTLSGTVTDGSTGIPYASVIVSQEVNGETKTFSTVTGTNGAYSFTNLYAGKSATLTVWADGYGEKETGGIAVTSSAQTQDVTLEQAGCLTVVIADGQSVTNPHFVLYKQGSATVKSYSPADGASFALELPASVTANTAYTLSMTSDDTQDTASASVTLDANKSGKATLTPVRLGVLDWSALGASGFSVLVRSGSYFVSYPASALRCSLPAGENGTDCTVYLSTNYEISGSPAGSYGSFTVRRGETTAVTGITPPKQEASIVGSVTGPATAAQGELYKISGVLESEIYGSDNAAFRGLRLMTNNPNALQGVTVNGTYVTVSGVATDGFVNKTDNTAVDWTFPLNFTFYLRQSDTAGTNQSAQVLAGYGEKTAVIGSVTTKAVPGITLCAPARVGARTVSVTANGAQKTVKQPDAFAFSGVAVKDRIVKLYDNETLIAIAKTDGKGRYSGTAYPAGSGYIHMLRAEQTTAEGDVISATAELAYDPSGPVLTELALYTNGSRTPLSIAGAPAAYTATGSTKYQYEATISNPGKLADMTVGNPAAAKTGDAETLTGKVFFRVHTVGGDYLLPAAQIGGENGLTWQSEEKYFGANYPTGVEVLYQAAQSASTTPVLTVSGEALKDSGNKSLVDHAYVLYNVDGSSSTGATKASDTHQTLLYELAGYTGGAVDENDHVTADWNDDNDPEFNYSNNGSWTPADRVGALTAAADGDDGEGPVYAALLRGTSSKSLSDVFHSIVSSMNEGLESDPDVSFATLTGSDATANGASNVTEIRTWVDQPTWSQSGVKWRIEELTGKGYKSSSASYGDYQYLFFTNTLYYDKYGKPSSLTRTVNSMGYPQTEPNPDMFKDGEMIGSSLKVEYLYSVKEGKWMRNQTAIIPSGATSPIHTAANQIPDATEPPYRYTPASALHANVRQLDENRVYASMVLAASNRTGGMSFKINPFKVKKETYAQGALSIVNYGGAKIFSKGDAWARANGEKGLTRFVDFNDAKYGSYALSVEETTIAGAGIGISSKISTPETKFGDITGIREQLMQNYRYYANMEKDPSHAYRSANGKKETRELLEALSDVEYAIEMAGVQDAFTAAVTDELGFYSGVFSLFGGPLGAEGALVYDLTSTLIKAANDTNNAEVKEAVDRLLARVDAYKASDSERKSAMKKMEQEKKDYNKEMGFGIYSVNEDVFNDPFSEGYQPPQTAETTPVHDPSGIVYEAVLSNPVPGATVTLYNYESAENPKALWDDSAYLGQANPVASDATGHYSWDVPEGSWYVVAEKAGYASGNSGKDTAATRTYTVGSDTVAYLPVLPAQLDVNIPLVDYTAPTVQSVEAKSDGVYITFSKYMDESTLTEAYFTLNGQPVAPTKLDSEQAPSNIIYESGTAPHYTKTVQLAGTLSGTVAVTVSDNVRSYAGVKMTSAYANASLSVAEKTQLAAPSISPASTDDAVRNALVTITATTGATIYYTTDGSAPTSASAKYTGPFPITKAMTVKAFAVQTGYEDSPVATATYRFAIRADAGNDNNTQNNNYSGDSDSGSGSPAAAPAPAPASNDGALNASATVSGGTASVAPISSAAIASAVGSDGGNAGLTLDLTSLGADVTTVSVPAASMQAIADALDGNSGSDSLTIATANGSVTLNESAVAAVAEQLGSGALELTMEGLAASDLNAAQTAALEGKEVEGGFTVALSSGGAPISDFGGGTAVLSFPFTPKAGAEAKDYRVYYAAPSGALARVPAAASNGVLHFRTSHFSDYVVAYEPQTNPFSDLTAAWYLDGALWAAANGVTNGMGDGRFLPDGDCTRAQAVTFLWRMSGSPEPRSAANFADVPAGSWYAKAVAWAVENGVTNGMDGAFNPDGVVTRAQVVTMLCRLESGKATKEAAFADVPRRQWYSDAVAWAVENGVANGMGGNLFGTDERCTRAQIVTFLYRDFVK